ncbi:hypothetical protein ABHF91_10505 [Pseudaeromonas sp. ZJS20]|uniref:hypothetical protein n=1 Tax=Pseudaeromonas aegiceratis TaxID=3153928 RepID=UPI00390C787A
MQEQNTEHTEGQYKMVWVLSGIAKRQITMETAMVDEAALKRGRQVSWRLLRPIQHFPWVVAKAAADAIRQTVAALQQAKEEPAAQRHVTWRNTAPQIKVSWLSRNYKANTPQEEMPQYLTLLLPKHVSWEGGKNPIKVSWV